MSRTPSVPTASQAPTLTLQIPFYLLGTTNISPWLYNNAERRTKPLHTLFSALEEHALSVPVNVWVPEPQPVLADMRRNTGSGGGRKGIMQVGLGLLGLGEDSEELRRKRKAILTVEERMAERKIDLEDAIQVWREREGQRWEEVKEQGWVLRRAEKGLGMDEWGDGDAAFIDSEKKHLGKNVWSCPVVLQKFDVDTSETGRRRLEGEMRSLCSVLRTQFHYSENEEGAMMDLNKLAVQESKKGQKGEDGRCMFMRVVCSEKCWLKVGIQPSISMSLSPRIGNDELEAQTQGWSLHTAAKVLVLLLVFERELMMLTTASSMLEFWPLSRFLEYWTIKKLRTQKRDKWRALRGGENKIIDFEKEERRWSQESDNEIEENEEFEEDTPGVWTLVDGMVRGVRGEERVEELIREMNRFEEIGKRLAVRFEMQLSSTKVKIFEPSDKSTETQKPDDDPPSTPPLPSPVPAPIITSIVFQGRRSSLDPEEISAYSNLVNRLIDYATSNSYKDIREKIQLFREFADDQGEEVEKSLDRFLNMLELGQRCILVLTGRWNDIEKGEMEKRRGRDKEKEKKEKQKKKGEDSDGKNDNEDEELDTWTEAYPFKSLLTHIRKTRNKEKEYMPTFINRYAKAGGFLVVPRTKIHGLLAAEERSRKEKTQGKRKHGDTEDWLDDLKSVRLEEGNEHLASEYEIGPSGLTPVIHSPAQVSGSPMSPNDTPLNGSKGPMSSRKGKYLALGANKTDSESPRSNDGSPRAEENMRDILESERRRGEEDGEGDDEEDAPKIPRSSNKISKMTKRFSGGMKVVGGMWKDQFEERRSKKGAGGSARGSSVMKDG